MRDNAKYLNSRETPLFDKGRALYNHGPAREAAGKGQPLIVAEGYMDVIALVEAGFEAAVAPLGTAITETQLGLALAHLARAGDRARRRQGRAPRGDRVWWTGRCRIWRRTSPCASPSCQRGRTPMT
jgi:hypothetical protein